ncbi:MAG: pentapeptide repeat-containing protein [Sedimentisphaerales bacterium]|nr:pentapeptide repeat-containing protein [Sedimentisphaerales bacterium]
MAGSTFVSATFSGSTFVSTFFSGSTIVSTTFSGSTFVSTTFSGSTFVSTTFSGSTLVSTVFPVSTLASLPVSTASATLSSAVPVCFADRPQPVARSSRQSTAATIKRQLLLDIIVSLPNRSY